MKKNNFIKRNIKNIIIIVLILFSLNRCTVACNRSMKINESENKIEKLDSVIKSQYDEISNLRRDIIEYKNRLGIYDKFNSERNKQDSIYNIRQKEQLDAIKKLQNNK